MIRMGLNGDKALMAALSDMSDEIKAGVGEAVMETAVNIEAEVKLGIMQGPASGRTYTRGGVTHQASAPGEAPMSDTGALAGSVFHEMEGELTATVGSRMAYANYLEFGTKKMAPRPIWEPTVEAERPLFRARVVEALEGATK
jgi:HK97 gp10 family phage protein